MTDQVVISDGKTLWIYIKDAKEVQINNYSSKVMDVNPAEIFTMCGERISVRIHWRGNKKANAPPGHRVDAQ